MGADDDEDPGVGSSADVQKRKKWPDSPSFFFICFFSVSANNYIQRCDITRLETDSECVSVAQDFQDLRLSSTFVLRVFYNLRNLRLAIRETGLAMPTDRLAVVP